MKKKELKEAELRVVKFELSDVIVASGAEAYGYCQKVDGYDGICTPNVYYKGSGTCNAWDEFNPDPMMISD